MAVLRILQLGDPTLRQVSARVMHAGDAAVLLENLRDTLHWFQRTHGFGRGISAVQIGDARRVIYLDFEDKTYCILNPELTWSSEEKFTLWDDCFSFPNLMVKLERARRIRVRYEDESGAELELAASGALSELLQHELDHLDGVLAIDRALNRAGDSDSLATREEWMRQRRF